MKDKPLGNVVIVGGGTMGGDIAVAFLAADWAAHVVEPIQTARQALSKRVAVTLDKFALKKKRGEFSIHGDLDSVPWDRCGLVIECVNEDLDLKRRIFGEIERLIKEDVPLTSNSSSLPIGRIGEGLKTQHRMLGLHFFMPAHLVPLVEVICAESTDHAVAERVRGTMAAIGKQPILVKRDIPGFVANRMQHALMREALHLVEQGIASPADIDRAVRYGFGFRYIAGGPLLQKDFSGLDILLAAGTNIYPDLCNDAAPSSYLRDKVARDELGIKSGIGFYTWTQEEIRRERAAYEARLEAALKILLPE